MSAARTVRITLNITPEEYRALIGWADSAAAVLGVARVSQQDTLRAMLHGALSNASAGKAAVKALRAAGGRAPFSEDLSEHMNAVKEAKST